jgi:hypothetical protein
MADSIKQFSNLSQQEQDEFYRKHIKLKAESGLPRTAYCKLHGLNYREFGYYERELESESNFLPIKLVANSEDLPPKPQVLCSIIFKNGAELKVYDTIVLPTLITSLG